MTHFPTHPTIPELEKIKEDYEAVLAVRDRTHDNYKPIRRANRHIDFLKYGLRTEDVQQGVCVERYMIVSVNCNKYRFVGRNVWYRFKNIPYLIERYFKDRIIQ